MNKFISNNYKNKDKWIKLIFFVCDALISLISLILISSKVLSALFILGIFIINVSALNRDIIINQKIESMFNEKMGRFFFIILFIFAFIPLYVGFIFEKAHFLNLFFSNTVPNILGAAIVYSIADHIKKFNYKNFVIKLLQTDYVIDSIIRIFYYFCFFNSANYSFNDDLKYTNIINNIYLFIVIICGLISGSAFFYRIFIDDDPFDASPKNVYPKRVLACGALYLFSCNIPSFFFETKTQPILLILNTITAFVVALFFLHIVIRKSEKCYDDYPFCEFGLFSGFIFLNCCIYFVHNVDDIGVIQDQVVPGGGILFSVILALWILNKKVKKQDDNKKDIHNQEN